MKASNVKEQTWKENEAEKWATAQKSYGTYEGSSPSRARDPSHDPKIIHWHVSSNRSSWNNESVGIVCSVSCRVWQMFLTGICNVQLIYSYPQLRVGLHISDLCKAHFLPPPRFWSLRRERTIFRLFTAERRYRLCPLQVNNSCCPLVQSDPSTSFPVESNDWLKDCSRCRYPFRLDCTPSK